MLDQVFTVRVASVEDTDANQISVTFKGEGFEGMGEPRDHLTLNLVTREIDRSEFHEGRKFEIILVDPSRERRPGR